MKFVLGLLCAIAVTGCSSSTSQYYEAVQAAAQANAAASQAKFDALSKIAAAGDGQAASAAVMALALTQTPSVTPVPQQSQALQWASILATPVTSLGMMWMQSDSAKTMAKYNADVSLARVAATAESNQALYGAFVDANQITGDVAVAGMNSAGNVDYSAFVDGLVTLGTTGMTELGNLGSAGFDSNVAISGAAITGLVDLGNAGLDASTTLGTAGLNTAVTLGTAGITGAVDLGTAGLDASTTLGTAGLDSTVTLGTAGLDSTVDLGTAGITGVSNVAIEGYGTMLTLDQGNNDLMGTVWADYNTAVQNIMDSVPQLSCTITNNADGTSTVKCTP